MQELSIKVSAQFIALMKMRKLSPLHIIPLAGEQYKHHFVVFNIDSANNIVTGKVGSADDGDIQGQVSISLDGEFTEIGTVLS